MIIRLTARLTAHLTLGVAACTFNAAPALAQSVFTGPIESREIAAGVYLLSAGSNAVLVVGKTEAVLVDGLVAAQAESLVQKVAGITQLPVKAVINTHYHGDHTGANAAFRKLGASVISTEDAARTMARATPNARGTLNAALPEAARPTETYTGSKTLRAAGMTFKMTEMPPSHTDGDVVVYIPEVNVLIMGDLHHSHEYPVYDSAAGCQCGSYDGNLEVDRTVLKMGNEKTVIVPGHGGVTSKAELRTYISMLEKVRTEVNAMIRAGKSADEVVAARLLANDKAPQPGGPDNRDSFVRVLYDALQTGRGK
jgi:glyoxylase-like metal-dependent hydrolase (beta-lactamase superfamily II)